MSGIARLFTQTVTVKTYLGSGAYGDVFADEVSRSCFVNQMTRLVRNGQGQEVVSTARLYGPVEDAPGSTPAAGQYTPGSQVTVNGATRTVISAGRMDAAGPANAHHVQVDLT